MIIDLKKAKDGGKFGNKAKGLYDLINLGLKVPNGFVISYDTDLREIENFIQKYIRMNSIFVVRSSSNMEDSSNYSFAGLFDTVVGVNKKNLLNSIKKVMSFDKNIRVKEFCQNHDIDMKKIKVSVIVQTIVPSEISGICFTKNPTTNDENEIYSEAILGQGEYVVSGEVNPDKYGFDKTSKQIIFVKPATQHKQLVLVGSGVVQEEPIFNYTQKMSNKLIEELSINALKIEKYYENNMDIEFAVYNGEIYYLQARPITT